MGTESMSGSRAGHAGQVECFREARWDEDEVIQRLCGALDFAECAVRQLGMCVDDAELPLGVSFEQLIAKTGILLLAASNVASYAAVGPRVRRVAALLVPHARSQRVLQSICLEPAAAFESAMAHICLNRLGFYDADFDAVLDLSAAALASDGRERSPHQLLKQEWLRQGWLFPEGLPRMRSGALVANSALNRTMDLLHGSQQDVRALLCALICLRDLNLFPRPLPRARETLLAEAEGLLARCLEREEYSLASEVLLAWPLTGESWSAAAAFGFRVVMSAKAGYRGDAYERSPAAMDAPVEPVFAMGILCAACLAPDRRPPVRLAGGAQRKGALPAVMACLASIGLDACWREELQSVPADQRESLTEFLLSIALHRAFRRRDFGEMKRVLAVGKGMGLASGPVACQAAEMVLRVSHSGLQDAGSSPWGGSEPVDVRENGWTAARYQEVAAG